MPKLPQHIEKLFDKKFGVDIIDEGPDAGFEYMKDCPSVESIKSFIATIIDEERKRVMKILDKHCAWKPAYGDDCEEEKGYQKGLQAEAKLIAQDIINLIKEDEI